MSNRQAQRDAQRDRRRQERAQARREARQARPSLPARPVKKAPPAPPPAKRSLRWLWGIVGIIVVAGLGYGIYYVVHSVTTPLPGTVYASQGNNHVNPGDPHPTYNSNPPTSGWHYPSPPKRGIYTSALPEELLIHFMEHAGVIVHYNPTKLPADQVKLLTNIVEGELNVGQGLVVLAPDPNIPQPIALTSWQHLEAFNFVTDPKTKTDNTSKIKDFIERLQCNYDPEGVCGTPHGNSFQSTATPVAGQATVIGQPVGTGVPTATAAPGQRVETSTPAPASATPTP